MAFFTPSFLSSLVLILSIDVAEASKSIPISFEPSGWWDGNDGPWSSFAFQIGNPPQAIRLLPSTSTSALVVMITQTCSAQVPGSCDDSRGSFFNISASSTWSTIGAFEIADNALGPLGYSGGATYGLDDVTLGWPGSGGATINDQVVGASGSGDYFIGIFGLSPEPNNFTDVYNRKASLLGSMKTQGLIPSSSYAYTAGAIYRDRKPLASLTLGGFDSSVFTQNDLSFPFGTDTSRRLLINVRSIATANGADNLLPNAIYAYIDSSDPYIWLPMEACQKFEEAFGLIWNDALQIYFFETSQNTTKKRSEGDSIIFELAENSTTSAIIKLEFPSSAFKLLASPPITRNGTTQQFFPLKRGANDTQFVLGRAFLQETYLIVDYERSNFSLHQTTFPGPSVPRKIAAIEPAAQGNRNEGKAGLSGGAIAGIVIGSVCALSVILILAWIYFRRRRAAGNNQEESAQGAQDEMSGPIELDSVGEGSKLRQDSSKLQEAGGDSIQCSAELPGSRDQRLVISEIDGRPNVPEMQGELRGVVYEMDASENARA